jgi:hypothetical protein
MRATDVLNEEGITRLCSELRIRIELLRTLVGARGNS